MKNLIILLAFLLTPFISFAQVAIGKTTVSSTSASLDFGVGNKGLILPWISNNSAITFTTDTTLKKGGVMFLDTADRKVKVSLNDGSWRDLTVHTNQFVTAGNSSIDTSLQDQPGIEEKTNAKALIGNNGSNDTTPGILVLSDNNKAMILPKVATPHTSIINPAPGMMVYDTTTRQLVVYNGTVWTYWKP